ncbi:MAG TPA: ABC transporter permease [Actinomycetota bacterium]|jgi:spermidine/putrescine transport system permease protein|nr:ABC transporter permease [Actinomycetota bacterium]
MEQHVRSDHHGVERGKPSLRKRLAPYGLIGPGGLWLAIFFLIPMVAMLLLSLETPVPSTGFKDLGYRFTWHFGEYTTALSMFHTQFIRSLIYAAIVTIATLLVGYPVAYWIAFKGGKHKTTFLFLLLLPFFVSFVIRSLAWQFILSDEGVVLGALKSAHLLPQNFHVLSTPTAVIAGIAYNSLPFMVLPLYVSLEKIDRQVIEAAGDLYSTPRDVIRKVVLPLSVPGIFAGFLLTFIPAVGDYVNNDILGGTNTTMIGNVIQRAFLNDQNYPLASALSFILMLILLVGIILYARVLGTRQIEEYL